MGIGEAFVGFFVALLVFVLWMKYTEHVRRMETVVSQQIANKDHAGCAITTTGVIVLSLICSLVVVLAGIVFSTVSGMK